MKHRYEGKDFLDAQPGQQTALLDLIAYRKNESPESEPGIQFFTWARRMVADAYYTSPIGMKELGYMGNGAVAEFNVPREAVEYASSAARSRDGARSNPAESAFLPL